MDRVRVLYFVCVHYTYSIDKFSVQMSRLDLIAGLDIGSSQVRLVVADMSTGEPNVLAMAQVVSEGVSKGVVTSIEDTVSTISLVREKAERMVGDQIQSVFVGISGSHITSQISKGVIAVARADGEITEEDVDRALEAAQAVATPPNFEIIHVIPKHFTVDNQPWIKDPVGMNGRRLEVEAQIIQAQSQQLKNLTKGVMRTGLGINDVVLSILASAEAVLTKRQKELGVCVLNIGAATTGLIVFEEGDVLHTAIIPVGAGHITADLAIGLRTSIDTAEKIKLEVGVASPSTLDHDETLDLSDFSEGESGEVVVSQIAEIIEARIEEVFKLVDKELHKIGRSGKLPAGIVITGGGAKLPGLLEVAKEEFRLPAQIGMPKGFTSAIEKINDPALSTAVGLLRWAIVTEHASDAGQSAAGQGSQLLEGAMGSMKKLFKSLLP